MSLNELNNFTEPCLNFSKKDKYSLSVQKESLTWFQYNAQSDDFRHNKSLELTDCIGSWKIFNPAIQLVH